MLQARNILDLIVARADETPDREMAVDEAWRRLTFGEYRDRCERAAAGHHVVHRYVMEPRLPLVRCPTLVIAPTADPHAYPHARKVADAIRDSRLAEIENGMVPLPDQMPERFAQVVDRFLAQAVADAR